ncbi:MAG: hypothetical protein LC737_09710 [Chloroflexi bacterium]|nr:hypothetical protein [Chloroflexota bacterium]
MGASCAERQRRCVAVAAFSQERLTSLLVAYQQSAAHCSACVSPKTGLRRISVIMCRCHTCTD